MTERDAQSPTPEGYDEAFAWFQRLLDAPASERDGLLEEASAVSAGLRAELEELLAVHDADDRRVAASVEAEVVAFADEAEGLTRIGRYRILRKIADGGMGTVYLAEQDQPRRQVALKVIRGGLATAGLLRRFELEAELLGTLDHPGIATIYEAGTERTPLGPLPFFAMEYVEGRPIDEHARHLDVREKLLLMAQLADAVQHAHRKGIVHRDLKPANVLVDASGQPKVLDFGVARLQEDEDRTLTAQGQIVGTLPYMSPEQVRGDTAAIDTRTDVYALGAITYELFTGSPPHDLTGQPLTTAARTILESDPKRLGTSDGRLRGDVETIVAKALAKEPERRYPSAEALAADIRRHLSDEPIEARPQSAIYVLKKFARRHKAPVAAGALVLLALVGGLIATTTLAAREARQRERADAKAHEAARETYRAQIAAADAALQVPDLSAARRFLEAVPENQRQWEWRYLSARLDDSAGAIARADAKERGWLLGLAVAQDETTTTVHTGRSGKQPTLRVISRRKPVRSRVLDSGQWRLSPDGARLLRLQEGRAWVHDVVGDERRALIPDETVLAVLGFDTVGKHALLALQDGIALVDVSTGAAAHRWPLAMSVRDVVFSPADRSFALVGDDTIRIYTPGSDDVRVLTGHDAPVSGLAFSPRGKRLVSVDTAGSVRLWTLEGGHILEARPGRRDEHGPLAFGPDGRYIAGAFADGTLRILEASTLIERARLAGESAQTATLPPVFAGGVIVTGRRDGTIQRFPVDLAQGHAVLDAHRRGATSVSFASDGRRLASAGADGFVRLWDAHTELPIGAIDLTLDRMPLGHRMVESVRFTHGGRCVEASAVTALGRTRLRYDAYTAKSLASHPEHQDETRAQTLTAFDDRRVVCRRTALDPERWSVGIARDSFLTRALFEGPHRPLGAGYERTTDVVHVLFDDGVCRSYDASKRTEVASRDLSRWNPKGLAVLDGGARWVVRTSDTALLVFDPMSSTPVLSLRGHGGAVVDMAVSPDGQRIASASADGTVRLWSPLGRGGRFIRRSARAGHASEVDRLIEAARAVCGPDDQELPRYLLSVGTYASAIRDQALDRTFGLSAAHATRGATSQAPEEQFERRYEVKLDEAGATPRRALGYGAAGENVRLEIKEQAALRMALGGLRFPETKIPSRTIALHFDRMSASQGMVLAELVVESFELPRHPMVAQMQEGLPDMAQVTGARLRVRTPTHGAWRILQVVDANLKTTEVLRVLEIVDQAFSDTIPPLPQEPVGVGAKWRVVESERVMGVDVRTIRNYELTGWDGDEAILSFTTERRAPKQDIDAPTAASQTRMTLTAFESKAEGTARFSPGLPLLRSVVLEAKQHVAADVDTRGVKQSTSLDLTGKLNATVKATGPR